MKFTRYLTLSLAAISICTFQGISANYFGDVYTDKEHLGFSVDITVLKAAEDAYMSFVLELLNNIYIRPIMLPVEGVI